MTQVKQAADTVDIHGAESSKNVELSALKVDLTVPHPPHNHCLLLKRNIACHFLYIQVKAIKCSIFVDNSSVQEILAKYNVSDDDLQKVLQWKHASI